MMKLLECHIENYGNISNWDYNFHNELDEFCEDNGYGKTTLASFIKAMFYGLPSYRTNAKEFPDRKHYYPFNGGKFGGSLTFEMGGTEYRIERFFGKKSEKEDTLTVYCKNKKYNGFGDDVGNAVFGIDQESFERTAFVNSDAIDICATGGISAKLNNFVEDLDDGSTIDRVITALEKPKKELKADRGDNGLIKATRQEISDITNAIKNIESIERTLEQNYIEDSKLKQAIRQQEAAIEEIKSKNLLIERWQQYESLCARKNGLSNALENLNGRFPHGIPSGAEINEMKECNRRIVSLSGKKTAAVFDEGKQRKLDELSAVFADGIPSDECLQDIKLSVEQIRNSEAQLNASSEQEQSERFAEQKRKFGNGLPNEQEISKIEQKVERYRALDNIQKVQTNVAVNSGKPLHSNARKFIILAVLAIIVAAGGAGLLFVNAIIGGIILGIGAVGLFAIGFLYLRNLSLNRQTVTIDESAVKQQAEACEIENAVREYLVRYGYYSQNGIVFDFEIFKTDLKEYIQNLDKAAVKDQALREQRERLNENVSNVKAVFAKYGIDDDDLQNAYITLQNMVSVLTALRIDSELVSKNQSGISKDIDECMATIKAIMSKYDICPSEDIARQLDDITTALNEFVRLSGEILNVDKEISEYKTKYKLTEKPAESPEDISDLTEQLDKDRHELALLESSISSAEHDVENLEDKRCQLESAEEKLEQYKNKYRILSAAIKFLKEAEQNLKDKYIAPLRDKFLHYANMIEATLGEKISIDQDFNIMFERGGEKRSDRHLSAGQRCVCALCFRLALVNNMYENEKPFIIMDDPFVHLDENHMERTRKTLKELSKDNQIIYFSCHNSRKITV